MTVQKLRLGVWDKILIFSPNLSCYIYMTIFCACAYFIIKILKHVRKSSEHDNEPSHNPDSTTTKILPYVLHLSLFVILVAEFF